jgi:carbon monoxide dehydrogenase subunit G
VGIQHFINRPQQEVWDFISNPANLSQWASTTESAEWISQGPPGVGSTSLEVGKVFGRKIEVTLEITAWDSPNEFSRKAISGPVPTEVTWKLEPKEKGTQLTNNGQAELVGFFRILGGLLGKQAEKQSVADLDALKVLLETG